MIQDVNKKVKFPENVMIKRRLRHGDQVTLSRKTGYAHKSVSAILNGRRPMNDILAKEIANILRERAALNSELLGDQDNPTQN